MKNSVLASVCTLGLFAAVAQAGVVSLNYSNNFESYVAGAFSTNSDWTVGPVGYSAAITDTATPEHGKVLSIGRTTLGHSSHKVLYTSQSQGTMTISFDFQVQSNAATTRAMVLHVGNASDNSGSITNVATYMKIDNGKIDHLVNGAWGPTVADFSGSKTAWHHLDLTFYLTGTNAKKVDIALDGVLAAGGTKLNWTDSSFDLTAKPLVGVEFVGFHMGAGTVTTPDIIRIDNLTIQVPEPATVGLMGLGSMLVITKRR